MASIRARETRDGALTFGVLWRDPNGKQCSMSFDSIQPAENFKRLIEANRGELAPTIDMLQAITRKSPTLSVIMEQHITGLASVAARTRGDYRRDATRHILPELGHIPISNLTAQRIRDWLNRLAAGSLSDKSIANVHGLLSGAVATAIEAGHRADNPCRGIRLPRRNPDADEMVCLTPQEWAALDAALGSVLAGHYQLLMRTLVGTGMRWGEVAALRLSDLTISPDGATVRIARAVKRDENNQRYIGVTKTRRSMRTISLPAALAGQLEQHTAGKAADDLVFTALEGGMVHSSNVRERAWLPAIAAAELTSKPRIHDLRHTHASWLIAAGVDLLTVQRRLGHESITTTSDRYSHVMPAQQTAAADAIGAILAGG